MSLLAPGEAWFEGLRVHADYRGQGLATRLERTMIAEATARGATTARLLTNVGNLPVHRNMYRHGFSNRIIVRPWHWTMDEVNTPDCPTALALQAIRPEESRAVYDWWCRSSAWHATGGLIHRDWSFSSTSSNEWLERGARGELLVHPASDILGLRFPPPTALVSSDVNDKGDARWSISVLSASGPEWYVLACSLVSTAIASGVGEIFALLPDTPFMSASLQRAGFVPGSDEDCLCLFERPLRDA